jgi:hypothetical protein
LPMPSGLPTVIRSAIAASTRSIDGLAVTRAQVQPRP